MHVTYLLHDPNEHEFAAVCEAAHVCTLRVTRGTTLRREALSMMGASPVVTIRPDQGGSVHDVGGSRWWPLRWSVFLDAGV
jgi:hypothetical protein